MRGDFKSRLFDRRLQAEGVLLFCTLIWGGTYIAIKVDLEFLSPLTLLAARFGVSTVLLGILAFSSVSRLQPNTVGHGVLLGLFMFAGFAFQTGGLEITSASKSGFITGLFVVVTPLVYWLLRNRRPDTGNYVGILLVLIGLYLLTFRGTSGFNRGDTLSLFSALSFGLYIAFLNEFAEQDDLLPLVFLQLATAAFLSAIGALLFEHGLRPRPGGFGWLSLLYLILPGTLLMIFLQTRFQKETSPVRAAVIYSLEPVFSALFAYFLLNERIGFSGIAGGSFMVTGVIVSEIWSKTRSRHDGAAGGVVI